MKKSRSRHLKSSRKTTKHGASVTEVLVALVLLALFISGASKLSLANYRLTDKAGAHYTAANLAKNRIESIRKMRGASYDFIIDMEETDVRVNDDGALDPDGKFSRTTTITQTATDGLIEAQITLKIMNPVTREFGTEQEYLQSYIARLLSR